MTDSQPAAAGDQIPLDRSRLPPPGQNPSAPESPTLTDAAARAKARDPHGYRRPTPPSPIERYDLTHPAVPPTLDGLTILHITDLHVRKGRPLTPSTRRAIDALRATAADLIFFTGDYMNHPGDEASTVVALREIVGACRARLGVYGIFGNHDTWELRRLARSVPGIAWLSDLRGMATPLPELRLVGSDEPEDLLATLVEHRLSVPPRRELVLTLIHYPTELIVGADFNLPILFAGHTHGGQFRLSPRFAPHTSCDLPPQLAGGVLRLRQTLCGVSRGLGNAVVELRVNCPPQIPMYVLRHGPLPSIPQRAHDRLSVRTAW